MKNVQKLLWILVSWFLLPFSPHKAGRFNYMVSQGWVFLGHPVKYYFNFYFYSSFSTLYFSFIFIFLTTTLGHKQALTSPCEGVQLINEVETPRLQGLAADEAKMFYLWSHSICSQDGFSRFSRRIFRAFISYGIAKYSWRMLIESVDLFGSTLLGGRHSLLPSSAILFLNPRTWCWGTLAW